MIGIGKLLMAAAGGDVTSTTVAYGFISATSFGVYDIANINSPTLLGSVTIPTQPYGYATEQTRVSVKNNAVFLISKADNMKIVSVNVSNPSSPSVLQTFDLTSTWNNVNAFGEVALDDTNDVLYLSSGDIGGPPVESILFAVNVSSPGSMSTISTLVTGDNLTVNLPLAIHQSDQKLYYAGIRGVDISNPASMSNVATLPSSGLNMVIDSTRDIAFLTTTSKNELISIDISSNTGSTLDTLSTGVAGLEGDELIPDFNRNIIIVRGTPSSGASGQVLYIFNIQDATNLSKISETTISGFSNIGSAGGFYDPATSKIYSNSGVVIDVSNTASPTVTTNSNITGKVLRPKSNYFTNTFSF